MVCLVYYLLIFYRNPTYDDSISWDVVDLEHPRLLDIGTELNMMDFPHTHAITMWDDMFDKYYYSRNQVGPGSQ